MPKWKALILALAVLPTPILAQAEITPLLTTHDGSMVDNLDLALMIDEFFEDGSPADGTVESNMLLFFTQCYGGDFLDIFDAEGADTDFVSFTDTTATSANEPGEISFYGGYHTVVSSALTPGLTAQEVHRFGTRGRDRRENPSEVGDLSKKVGGETSTHVLVWAGDPNDQDRQDITNIVANFRGRPATTVHVLAADGSSEEGTTAVTGPATRSALEDTLREIGQLMDDGEDEQFIFFVTDHGTTLRSAIGSLIDPSTSIPGTEIEIALDTSILEDILLDAENQIELVIEGPSDLEGLEPLIGVDLNGVFLGNLDQAIPLGAPFADPDHLLYSFPVEETFLNSPNKQAEAIVQVVGVTNFSDRAVELDLSISTGRIARRATDCGPNGSLCLDGERFRVEVEWKDFEGITGRGTAVPAGSENSGLLWFFTEENWEMLIKVLDGCELNDHFWIFAAASTNVEYTLTVIDQLTGASKTYFNPLGRLAPSITDIEALNACVEVPGRSSSDVSIESLTESAAKNIDREEIFTVGKGVGGCADSASRLCLTGRRFQVEVEWQDFENRTGRGRVVPLRSRDSGLFYFFDEDNWEVLIKVLDGCAINDHFWVFFAATTNVGYTMRVLDTVTGQTKVYTNPLGAAAEATADTLAFPSCAP